MASSKRITPFTAIQPSISYRIKLSTLLSIRTLNFRYWLLIWRTPVCPCSTLFFQIDSWRLGTNWWARWARKTTVSNIVSLAARQYQSCEDELHVKPMPLHPQGKSRKDLHLLPRSAFQTQKCEKKNCEYRNTIGVCLPDETGRKALLHH